MALTINNDINSMFTLGSMRKSGQNLAAVLEKLGSGQRINKAADDSAGMQIANALESQARGMGQAIRNANDAVAVTQIADSALQQVGDIMSTVREKALQAANASQSEESRQAIQADVDRLLAGADQIINNTSYNGQRLLSGGFTDKAIQTGAEAGQTITLTIPGLTLPGQNATAASNQEPAAERTEGQSNRLDLTTREGAEAALGVIDATLTQINRQRSELGAAQNQLLSGIANLSTSEINTQAAQSTIRDADMAEETMFLAQAKMLRQTQLFALTQTRNLNKENALNLLQG